jgi:hypothetical protein
MECRRITQRDLFCSAESRGFQSDAENGVDEIRLEFGISDLEFRILDLEFRIFHFSFCV